MFTSMNRVATIYDRLVTHYGISEGTAIHQALIYGAITPEVRRKVRAIATADSAMVTLH